MRKMVGMVSSLVGLWVLWCWELRVALPSARDEDEEIGEGGMIVTRSS